MLTIAGTQSAKAQEEITDKEITCFYVAAQHVAGINYNALSFMTKEARGLQTPAQRVYDIFEADMEGKMPADLTDLERKDYLSVKQALTNIKKEWKQTVSEYFEDTWIAECLSESRFDYIFEKAKKDPDLVKRMQEIIQKNNND